MKLIHKKRLLRRVRVALLPAVFKKVREQSLTYLSPDRLISIYESLRRVKRERVPGDFAEFGIALGGSAIAIAKQLDGERRFYGFDVFRMIPPPSESDDDDARARYDVIQTGRSPGLGGDPYYGYVDNLYQQVVDRFGGFGIPIDQKRVHLVRGLFEDTVVFPREQRFAFLHIDCDWFEPVQLCLERTLPHLSPNALVIIDDYNDYRGCRRATDEFLRDHPELTLIATHPHAILRRS